MKRVEGAPLTILSSAMDRVPKLTTEKQWKSFEGAPLDILSSAIVGVSKLTAI